MHLLAHVRVRFDMPRASTHTHIDARSLTHWGGGWEAGWDTCTHTHKDAHAFRGGAGKRARALRGWAAGRGTRTPDICNHYAWGRGLGSGLGHVHTHMRASTHTDAHSLTHWGGGWEAGWDTCTHTHKDAHAFRGGAGKRARALRGWAVGRGAQQLCPCKSQGKRGA